MNDVGVVVSRFYEDLKWIEQLKAPIDVYVYNRLGNSPGMGVHAPLDKDINDIGGLDVEMVKNNGVNLTIIYIPDDPGFETSTYAYHLHSKYDSLNEVTVFLQAHPMLYIHDIIELLNNPQQLKYTQFVPQFPGPGLLPAKRTLLDTPIEFSYVSNRFAHLAPMDGVDYGWTPYMNDYSKAPWLKFCQDIAKDGWPPSPFNFGEGNQFMVNRKRVWKHPVEYYRELQNFVNTHMDPNPTRPPYQQYNQGPNIIEGIAQFIF